jgi:hypothetical protein
MTDNDSAINKHYFKIHKIGDAYFIGLDPTLIENTTDSFTEEISSEGILLRPATTRKELIQQ